MTPADCPPLAARVFRFLSGVALVLVAALVALPGLIIVMDYITYERAKKEHEAYMEKADRENERLRQKLEKTIGRKL